MYKLLITFVNFNQKTNVFEAETCWPGIDVTLLGGQDDYEFVVSDLFSIIRSEKYKKNPNELTES